MYSPPPYTPPPYYTPPPPPRRRSRGPLVLGIVALLTVLVVGGGVAFYVLGQRGGCGADGVTLNVSSSPEKFGVMEDLAEQYSGTEVNGVCAQIAVQSKSSGEAMAALARGWDPAVDRAPRPDVWTPAASTWVGLLRHRLSQSGKIDFLPAETPGVAVSPLVIAMPRPMAQALGWPNSAIGWSDILKLSRDPRGWGMYGHPEWGPFKLGKTNPNYSTSGLNATVGAYFAATEKAAGGTPGSLTASDVDASSVKAFVRDVESSIVHYGDTTLTFLSGLQRADDAGEGLGYVSAVAVEEMSVRYYNQGNPTGNRVSEGQHSPPKIPLVAIYPEEGTIVSDHPYVALGTMDPGKRAIADDFLAFLRGTEGQKRFARDAFRGYDNQVTNLITEDNGLLPGQPTKMLAPPEPAVLDKVLRGWESLRKRSNVLWVVDVSGSMVEQVPGTGKTRMELAKASLTKAMDQFIGVDKVGLWEFATRIDGNRDYRELVPIGSVAQNRARLKQAVGALQPKTDTGLYDTALAAFTRVKQNRAPDAINSVVLLTDGVNDDSNSITLEALLGRLDGESGVRLFTIGFSDGADHKVLARIAEATDAKAYDARDAATIDEVIGNVTSNF
ncbi:substrate-binding and VWA domain-containing protein [Actinocorallia sp. API 0066]|uniref:substrate-binding and VWA domain-containing protein n=1 Tax=Actinocorallia sp. API 0066 TaxID=2896846 RepID=UPI001E3BE53D|nr:substrate-binding and VWA domain-containing protein [Actinocorallia sp. API 0066]MCD0448684.1 substrate-binding and VWA domain-containing protein [Actinocorallia sp. API 0066]